MFPAQYCRLPLLLLLLGALSDSTASADIVVNTVAQLVSAVNNTQTGGDRIILIADGTYLLNGNYLRLAVNNITVRSQSGKRERVILDGNYQTTEIFQVVASGATIADLTLKRAYDHPIHVMATNTDVENTLIRNVHIIDPGQQAIKINPNAGRTHFVNNGRITGCLIELTESGRAKVWERNGSCYTGGVDAHQAEGWIIEDNEIQGFWCAGGLAEHGVHFWSDSSGTLVQRNLIVDCDRGIGFGLGSSGHSGGIIRNNMIYHGKDHGMSDVGIGLESASDAQVYNNTIFHEHSYPNGIEYRFAASNNLTIVNNLTNRAITSRDEGTATLISNNVTNATKDWFTDAPNGDLHLNSELNGVTGAALAIPGLIDDFDKQNRPQGTGPDIGADEYFKSAQPTLSWLLLLL
ncbi:MAG: right-handed parallel beta-helix repeat-containing protein [Deltaproteobacteria bacterium]|nr:right-handed parallel beta-helix repeat-containing protein [Deltaproteobacteria bacterium]